MYAFVFEAVTVMCVTVMSDLMSVRNELIITKKYSYFLVVSLLLGKNNISVSNPSAWRHVLV